VKRKAPSTQKQNSDSKSCEENTLEEKLSTNTTAGQDTEKKLLGQTAEVLAPGQDSAKSYKSESAVTVEKDSAVKPKPLTSGLSLLGNYSDSSEASDSD
jgi:hypothetical protein